MAPPLEKRGRDEAKAQLSKLHDVPQATPSESVLILIFDFLVGSLDQASSSNTSSKSTSRKHKHWFCHRADEVAREAATFLLRLHAYNSPRVESWRKELRSCLRECCECVRHLQLAKLSSRHTYFGSFNDEVLGSFWTAFCNWEIESIISDDALIDLTSDASSPTSLSVAPPALVYHMLSSPSIVRDPRILSILHKGLPQTPQLDLPKDYPPVGLLILLMDDISEIREWATRQMTFYETAPMSQDDFGPMYTTILDLATRAVTYENRPGGGNGTNPSFTFVKSPTPLWIGYRQLLRFVPPELLRPCPSFGLDLRQVVVGHLHDTEPHFVEVLKSFLLVLARIGPEMWAGEDAEYPHVVFNSIKHNPRYLETLQALTVAQRTDWSLNWLETYLKSIGHLPILKEVLPTIIQFLCEELQHERFQGVRSAAMTIAARLLIAVVRSSEQAKTSLHRDTVREIMDIHASIFISIAFAKGYTEQQWTEARNSTRNLVKLLLHKDVENTQALLLRVCIPSDQLIDVSSFTIREHLWRNIYDNMDPSDSEGIAVVIDVLAEVAHIDDLKEAIFIGSKSESERLATVKEALINVNNALKIFRGGFDDAIIRFLDFSRPSVLQEFLRRPNMVKQIIILMMSPVENVQEAAQALGGAAFEVDVRLDCFRALLQNFPQAALDGVCEYLQTYSRYAPRVPEACSLSKALARCLTDIIDVLCSSSDGLLRNEIWRRSTSTLPMQLPRWWRLMTTALAVIFRYTPKWATYFDNEEMVLWMRDALIFGRDMLSQWRVIESGALPESDSLSSTGKRKLSQVAKAMMNDLQPVMLDMIRWLRLTDEELLHQSFTLLEALLSCFLDTATRPSQEALEKLQKHCDDKGTKKQTILDSSRLQRLREAISVYDDEIEIVSHTIPKPVETTASRKARQVVHKDAKIPKRDVKRKPSPPKIKRPLPQPSRPAVKPSFTTADQKKLDTISSMPTLKRSASAVDTAKQKVDSGSVSSKAAEPSSSSSEGEESESDEGEGKGLASLAKVQRTPTIKKPAERRQVKMLEAPPDPRLAQIRRFNEARVAQMRLKPDISGLHRKLLSWDYNHNGPLPPGEPLQLNRVPDRFQNFDHYRRIFEPLLLLECWAQLQESKEEVGEEVQCKIMSRGFTDSDWVDMDVVIPASVESGWKLTDADIVCLKQPNNDRCTLAKVLSFRGSAFEISASIRCFSRSSDPELKISTTWRLRKVLNLTTIHREYAAMMSLPYIDLSDDIFKAKAAKCMVPTSSEVQRTMTTYNVNEPQATAILNSLDGTGFALIQGPPGTGKTSTICGLIHAFLSKRPKPSTNIHAGRNSTVADRQPVKKVLLCAPSNAAIDELAYRLKEGVSGAGQRANRPNVVRLGAQNAIGLSVKEISLDYLIDRKINESPEGQNNAKSGGSDIDLLRSELAAVRREKQEKINEMDNLQNNAARKFALEEDIRKLNRRKVALTNQFDKLKDKQKSDSRTMDAIRRKFRTEVLQEADVICTTLSGASHETLEQFDFEFVIIDEAAQAIELSSLIPLKYRCSRCVMVGDPQQLPPTVKSQEACNFGYNQSLFVRLQQQNPDAVQLLSIQYRMHPDISALPSQIFYNGRLNDGPDMRTKTSRPWHSHSKFGTYRFFNVVDGREESSPRTHSFMNRAECQMATSLYHRLRRDFSGFDFDFKVGIISMYRGQILELRRAFEQRFGAGVLETVDFNTVDGFQGQEKDIIILSCVRAGPGVQTVGFLKDVRRMNVALTRAKSSLFVLGHAPTLERSDETWRDIVQDARKRSSLVDVDATYFTTPATKISLPLPAPPSKPSKPPSKVEAPPIPSDLMTPRQFIASRTRQPDDPKPAPAAAAPDGSSSSPTDPPMNVDLNKEQRKEETAVPSRVAQQRNAPEVPRPKPQLAKRPKQAPTLFIPKNKNKRPPPGGGPTGPSSNRQRLGN